jgi:hypothetical protein
LVGGYITLSLTVNDASTIAYSNIDYGYDTINVLKGILLGGFITNAIDSITLHCDFSSSNTTGSVVVDDPVMQYFKAGLNIIFGLMLMLAIIYLITGKGFGL